MREKPMTAYVMTFLSIDFLRFAKENAVVTNG